LVKTTTVSVNNAVSSARQHSEQETKSLNTNRSYLSGALANSRPLAGPKEGVANIRGKKSNIGQEDLDGRRVVVDEIVNCETKRPANEQKGRQPAVEVSDEGHCRREVVGHSIRSESTGDAGKQDEVSKRIAMRHVNQDEQTKQQKGVTTSGVDLRSANSPAPFTHPTRQELEPRRSCESNCTVVVGLSGPLVENYNDAGRQVSSGDVSLSSDAGNHQQSTISLDAEKRAAPKLGRMIFESSHGEGLLLSCPHNDDDDAAGDNNKKQHGKDKGSTNKHHIPLHSYSIKNATAAAAGVAHEQQPLKTKPKEPSVRQSCDKSRQQNGVNLKSTKLPTTRISSCKVTTNSPKKAHTNDFDGDDLRKREPVVNSANINANNRPKPMGQKVLSLMMLDAGLFPANVGCQSNAAQRESHVRLQDERELLNSLPTLHGDISADRKNCKAGNPEAAFTNDTKAPANLSIDQNDDWPAERIESTPGYYQPLSISCSRSHEVGYRENFVTAIPNGSKPKQKFIRFDAAGQSSISLPSSPRAFRLREDFRLSIVTDDGPEQHLDEQPLHDPTVERMITLDQQMHSDTKVEPMLLPSSGNEKLHGSITSWLSPVRARRKTQRLSNNNSADQSCRSNQSDSQSSSCSSLHNHYPPLLRLSNQLDGPAFRELLRSSARDLSGALGGCSPGVGGNAKGVQLTNKGCKLEDDRITTAIANADSGSHPRPETLAAQITRQHEKLLAHDLDTQTRETINHLGLSQSHDDRRSSGSVSCLIKSDGAPDRSEANLDRLVGSKEPEQRHGTARQSNDAESGWEQTGELNRFVEKNILSGPESRLV